MRFHSSAFYQNFFGTDFSKSMKFFRFHFTEYSRYCSHWISKKAFLFCLKIGFVISLSVKLSKKLNLRIFVSLTLFNSILFKKVSLQSWINSVCRFSSSTSLWSFVILLLSFQLLFKWEDWLELKEFSLSMKLFVWYVICVLEKFVVLCWCVTWHLTTKLVEFSALNMNRSISSFADVSWNFHVFFATYHKSIGMILF